MVWLSGRYRSHFLLAPASNDILINYVRQSWQQDTWLTLSVYQSNGLSVYQFVALFRSNWLKR